MAEKSAHGGKTIGGGSEEDLDLHPEREVVSVLDDVVKIPNNSELVVVGITGARGDDGHESNGKDNENGETLRFWSDVEGLDDPNGKAEDYS